MRIKNIFSKLNTVTNTSGLLAFGRAFLFSALFVVLPIKAFTAQEVAGLISDNNDAAHIEFQGLEKWSYDLQKKTVGGKTQYELLVPALDQKTKTSLTNWKSAGIQGVKIEDQNVNGQTKITFTVADASVEAFDYLTDQPSRLIIDFFRNDQAPKKTGTAQVTGSSKEKKTAETSSAEKKKNNQGRMPAQDGVTLKPSGGLLAHNLSLIGDDDKNKIKSGVFDGADPFFERFKIQDYEKKPHPEWRKKQNVYLEFPMLKIGSSLEEYLKANPLQLTLEPEAEGATSDEFKQIRLIETLYGNKRYNVLLKSLPWFLEKYPESKYTEQALYYGAETQYQMWLQDHKIEDFEKAVSGYQQILKKFPDSARTERTSLFLARIHFIRGDYLEALKQYQGFIAKYKKSLAVGLAQLDMAEVHSMLKKYDDAYKVLSEVENSKNKDQVSDSLRAEAAYRKGDIQFLKKDFIHTIQDYSAAQKNSGTYRYQFPNAIFNQAAAYFGLDEYDRSLILYTDFIKNFPNHSYASFAMTRVGELLDILGADKSKVIGAYLETYFRYGDTTGALVARLRLLTIKMQTMKDKELNKAVSEMTDLAQKTSLPKVDQFSNLLMAEGFTARKEYDRSNDLLIKYFQANPVDVEKELFLPRIGHNVISDIKAKISGHQFIQALKTYKNNSDSWLKNIKRTDLTFGLGQAYEQGGVYKEARNFYQKAQSTLAETRIDESKSPSLNQLWDERPSMERLNLRQAQVMFQAGENQKSLDELKKIKTTVNLTPEEQIERVKLASSLYDKKGDTEIAMKYLDELIKEWQGKPILTIEPLFQLAQYQMKLKQTDEVIETLQRLDKTFQEATTAADKTEVQTASLSGLERTHSQSLEMLGRVQLSRKELDSTIATYEKLLEQYEAKRPLAGVRYKLGELYFQKGDLNKASLSWKPLQKEEASLWNKLAQEKMRSSEWEQEYKKYVNRVPAMATPEAKE